MLWLSLTVDQILQNIPLTGELYRLSIMRILDKFDSVMGGSLRKYIGASRKILAQSCVLC